MIRIHRITPYDRGAKACWLLTELGIHHEIRWLDREKGENETPEYLRLNPMGRVPVLEHDDRRMYESTAICQYLADRFTDRPLAPAPDSPSRPLYLQWLFFSEAMLSVCQTRIMVIEDIPAGELQTAKLTALQGDLRDAVKALDLTLEKSEFLVDGRLTAADICVSYHLYWCSLWPELGCVLEEFPRVSGYVERMKARPAAIEAKAFSYPG